MHNKRAQQKRFDSPKGILTHRWSEKSNRSTATSGTTSAKSSSNTDNFGSRPACGTHFLLAKRLNQTVQQLVNVLTLVSSCSEAATGLSMGLKVGCSKFMIHMRRNTSMIVIHTNSDHLTANWLFKKLSTLLRTSFKCASSTTLKISMTKHMGCKSIAHTKQKLLTANI